jgi:hypothetical protein
VPEPLVAVVSVLELPSSPHPPARLTMNAIPTRGFMAANPK